MKKKLAKLVVVGLMASFCLSACSKDKSEENRGSTNKNDSSGGCGCESKNDSVIQQEKSAEQTEAKVEMQ